MDQKTARKLDRELEKAITKVVCRLGLKKLPLLIADSPKDKMPKNSTEENES
jgi:hypothetical protein